MKEKIIEPVVDLGVYVNADEIKKIIEKNYFLDFKDFKLEIDQDDFYNFIRNSSLTEKIDDIETILKNISINKNRIWFNKERGIDDYFISLTTSYIWYRLLEKSKKFSVETVMSHASKLEFIKEAHKKGFKVYLYFVSLANPTLNVLRVQSRVDAGGHEVSKEKIISRYARTMNFLLEAIKLADTCYILDNSNREPKLIAVKEKGELSIQNDYIPTWFNEFVINKLEKDA